MKSSETLHVSRVHKIQSVPAQQPETSLRNSESKKEANNREWALILRKRKPLCSSKSALSEAK